MGGMGAFETEQQLLQQSMSAAAAVWTVQSDDAERELAACASGEAAAESDSALLHRLATASAAPSAPPLLHLPQSHLLLWAAERGLAGRPAEAEAVLALVGGGSGDGGGAAAPPRAVEVARLHSLAVHVCMPRRRFAAAARLLQLALRLALPGCGGGGDNGGGDAALAASLEAAICAAATAAHANLARATERQLRVLQGSGGGEDPGEDGGGDALLVAATAGGAFCVTAPWPARLVAALAAMHLQAGAGGAAREALEWAAAHSEALAASPRTQLRLAECAMVMACAGGLPSSPPPPSPYDASFAADYRSGGGGGGGGDGGSNGGATPLAEDAEAASTPLPPPPLQSPTLPAELTATETALAQAQACLLRCIMAVRTQLQQLLSQQLPSSPLAPHAKNAPGQLTWACVRGSSGVGGAVTELLTSTDGDADGDDWFSATPEAADEASPAVDALLEDPLAAAVAATAAAASSSAPTEQHTAVPALAHLRRIEAAALGKLAWVHLAQGDAHRALRTASLLLEGAACAALTPGESAAARAVLEAARGRVAALGLG